MLGSSGEGGSSVQEGGIGSGGGGGGGGSGSGEFYEGDRSTGGNRWPRQETLALLQIRSDMDGVFRDSSLKGPLWEQVSRKMEELGYHRSSKKCREKFENVYKYHKRTKDGRVGKSDGKSYRFFDQLEALEQQYSTPSSLPPLPPTTPRGQQSQSPAQNAVPVTIVIPAGTVPAGVTVTSSPHHINTITTDNNNTATIAVAQQVQHQHVVQQQQQQQPQPQPQPQQYYHQHLQSPIQVENGSSPSDTPTSSSSTSSDEEVLGKRTRKRKWEDYFERLMREVVDKQEQLQKSFLEDVERREHDRLVREEAWKAQEMGRLNREHEILVRERSMAAAKDAALIELLKKLSDQHKIPLPFSVQVQPQPQTQNQVRATVPAVTSTVVTATPQPRQLPPQPQPQPQPMLRPPRSQQPQLQVTEQENENHVSLAMSVAIPAVPMSQQQPQPQPLTQVPQQVLVLANSINANVDIHESNNGGENQQQASSSRWPKVEVEALINLRSKLDEKYQDNSPKGPLWEEISAAMKQLGYNRNAKRCKEKWENINKYFKKVKESNKKRPEDSKTCPYFHQLDALYRKKTIKMESVGPIMVAAQVKPENLNTMGPIMAQPQQQWRPQDHEMDDDDNDDSDDGDDDGDDQGSGYEIVANNGNNNNAATT